MNLKVVGVVPKGSSGKASTKPQKTIMQYSVDEINSMSINQSRKVLINHQMNATKYKQTRKGAEMIVEGKTNAQIKRIIIKIQNKIEEDRMYRKKIKKGYKPTVFGAKGLYMPKKRVVQED